MPIEAMVVIGIVIAVIIGALVAKKKKKNKVYQDIVTTTPPKPHRFVHYGYYLSFFQQLLKTYPHISLHWYGFKQTVDELIDELKAMPNVGLVIDLHTLIFTGEEYPEVKKRSDEEAWANCIAFFDRLRAEGFLNQVLVLYPIDEPNHRFRNGDSETLWAIDIAKRLRAHYPEMANAKIGVIYMTDRPYYGKDQYELIGLDDYKRMSSILAKNSLYDQLIATIRPDQQIWLVAGGGTQWKHNPKPWVDYALANPRVWAVICFLWTRPYLEQTDPGVQDMPDMKEAWTQAGRVLIGKE